MSRAAKQNLLATVLVSALCLLLLSFGVSVLAPRAHATLPVGSPLAGMVSCGTSATCTSPARVAGGVIVTGTATLGTGTVTITGLPDFTSATSYGCVANDTNGAYNDALSVVNAAGTTTSGVYYGSIVITSHTTEDNDDTVAYVCMGK